MRNAVIPAPVRIDHKGGEFALRSSTTIAYTNIEVAPIVERFCSEVTRRMGLRVLPITGNPRSNEPSIGVELTTGDELGVLPAPSGISPLGDRPCDECSEARTSTSAPTSRAGCPTTSTRRM